MIIDKITELDVFLEFNEKVFVGRLAANRGQIYFEYDQQFLGSNLEISPFKLPLKSGLQVFQTGLFGGLPGVFSDSLPDGWGHLLLDRWLRTQNRNPAEFGVLDRLAFVGEQGMGALVYQPTHQVEHVGILHDLDKLAEQSKSVLQGDSVVVLDDLIAANGSSAGARPKALISVGENFNEISFGSAGLAKDREQWLVKFPNIQDGSDSGAIEYVYYLMARKAGVVMADCHFFPAKRAAGYFATRRFDRKVNTKVHMHSVAGLVHADFRQPSLDYKDLLSVTEVLTRDLRDVEKMFRLAVFNVLAHNRDDHAKNFSFLMSENGQWNLSPAYDLTFSSGPGGEQSTLVMGEGRNPSPKHLIKLGEFAKLSQGHIRAIIEQTKNALSSWKELAMAYNVSMDNISLIDKAINGKNWDS